MKHFQQLGLKVKVRILHSQINIFILGLGESIAYCTMKDNVIDMFNPETRQHFPSFRGILL